MNVDTESLISYLKPEFVESWEKKSDFSIVYDAIRFLEYLGETRAVPALTALLEYDDHYIRNASWETLAKLRDPRAIPAMIMAFIKAAGRYPLGTIDDIDEQWAKREDVKALVPNLISVLDRSTWPAWREEADRFWRKYRRDYPMIMGLLSEDLAGLFEMRRIAAKMLGEIGDDRATPVLIDALADEAVQVRSEAATALGMIGDKKAVQPLLEALKKMDDPSLWEERRSPWLIPIDVKRDIVLALGDIGDTSAFGAVLGFLKAEKRFGEPRRLIAALYSLGKLGDERAVKTISETVRFYSSNPDIKEAGIEALQNIKCPASAEALAALKS